MYKGIINCISYGLDVLEKFGLVIRIFLNLRRVCVLFNKFEDCEGFVKELGVRKGVVKFIVDDSKKGIMKYNFK